MELKDFIKKLFWSFLMIQAGINIAIGVIGLLSHTSNSLSPAAFFMPFIYAFFCSLVSLVTYSSKELSTRNLVLRKIIQLVLVEAVVLIITYMVEALVSTTMLAAVSVSVFMIFLLINLTDYLLSKAQAEKLTEKLKTVNQVKNADL